MKRKLSLEERFWNRVQKTSTCWLWTGKKSGGGYGSIRLPNGRYQSAHRTSWELHTGVHLSDEVKILHKCDTPSCVRFEDLFDGTQADNVRDMIEKGRAFFQTNLDAIIERGKTGKALGGRKKYFSDYPRGIDHPQSKLTNQQVREIRKRRKRRENYETLALIFKVGKSTIGRIVNKDTIGGWSHI